MTSEFSGAVFSPEHLKFIVALEREWSLMGGPDNSPARKALMVRIKNERKIYEAAKLAWINAV